MAELEHAPRLSLPSRTVDARRVRARDVAARAKPHTMIRRRAALWLFAVAVLAGAVVPARSCGPELPEAIFVARQAPADPKAFGSGQMGILLPSYYQRYLYLAY